jgi:hypothetical protein
MTRRDVVNLRNEIAEMRDYCREEAESSTRGSGSWEKWNAKWSAYELVVHMLDKLIAQPPAEVCEMCGESNCHCYTIGAEPWVK